VDVAYAIRGTLAEELRRAPGLTLKPVLGQVTNWIYFAEQWDPKSPWHDRRVRLAANHAIDRQAINQAEILGFAKLTGSIIPSSFEFYWQSPGYAYDAARAKRLLAEAGYPNGFDAGDYFCDAAVTYLGEPVVNYLNAAGIRVKLRPLERAAYFRGWSEKKYHGLIQGGSGAFSATRPPGSRPSWPGAAHPPTEAMPTSMGSSANKRTSWTRSGARRPCTASSSSSTTK
jgi:peptide/nickel transport system substrate-binding protein